LDSDEPAFARTNRSPKLTPSAPVPTADDVDIDDEVFHPRRHTALYAGLLAAAVLLVTFGYLALFKRDGVRGLFAGHAAKRGDEAYRQGREYFLLDSDDAFRNAIAAFERAHAADEKRALPLAALAEVKTTWAAYLRDDARSLETGAPSVTAVTAAKTLRREAQAHLDEAKKWASEALNLDSEAPEVNRAMADYLRVDGAPAREGGRYLRRAGGKRAADPESAYVAGALALREGNLEVARTKLMQANQLNQAATQHALLRASYLLARIAMQTNNKEAAKLELQTILAANAQHDRARALLASTEPTQPTADNQPPTAPPAAAPPPPGAAPP